MIDADAGYTKYLIESCKTREMRRRDAYRATPLGGVILTEITLDNTVHCPTSPRLQACIREHAGLSVDEVMSLLARFRVGSRDQSAPWLSLGTRVSFSFAISDGCLRGIGVGDHRRDPAKTINISFRGAAGARP
jgi:hypothetical protein